MRDSLVLTGGSLQHTRQRNEMECDGQRAHQQTPLNHYREHPALEYRCEAADLLDHTRHPEN